MINQTITKAYCRCTLEDQFKNIHATSTTFTNCIILSVAGKTELAGQVRVLFSLRFAGDMCELYNGRLYCPRTNDARADHIPPVATTRHSRHPLAETSRKSPVHSHTVNQTPACLMSQKHSQTVIKTTQKCSFMSMRQATYLFTQVLMLSQSKFTRLSNGSAAVNLL